jgi:DNA-binding MarR family transcriptional regulator
VLRAGEPVFREFLTAMAVHLHAQAEAAGLGLTDYYTLNLLGAAGPLTAGQLAGRTGLTTGATTRLIDRLERDGYVRRTADPADRRKVLIELAAARAAPLAGGAGPARARLATVFLGYTADQLDVLFGFFSQATAALLETAATR